MDPERTLTSRVLRVVVALLFGAVCYAMGFTAGFSKADNALMDRRIDAARAEHARAKLLDSSLVPNVETPLATSDDLDGTLALSR